MKNPTIVPLLLFWSYPVSSWTSWMPKSRHSRGNRLLCLHAAKRRTRRSSGTKANKPSASTTSSSDETSAKQQQQQQVQKSIYSLPALYDLAFGYRDFEAEVDFLLHQHQRLSGGRPARTVLELAAGPARHCWTALSSSHHEPPIELAVAMDQSQEMAAYAKEIAQQDYDISTSRFDYRVNDMRNFTLSAKENSDDDDKPSPVMIDTAWILLGSLQHLVKNEDIISCFESVRRVLRDDGSTVFVELPHPRETFSMVECTRNGWKVPLDDEEGREFGELHIVWGDDDDAFDPVTQVRQFTVAMKVVVDSTCAAKNNNEVSEQYPKQNVREVVPMRLFTAQEMNALAQCAGMKVVDMFGALEEGVSVNDDEEAFRLVCALQKR